jgi:hypothetical protein
MNDGAPTDPAAVAPGPEHKPSLDPLSLDLPSPELVPEPARPPAPSEAPLPLRELDRSLAPVRRMVLFATTRGLDATRYFGLNLARQLARAAGLELPRELRDRVAALQQRLDGFDADSAVGRRDRLADLFAELARVDLLLGLPIPEGLRPVPKVRQVDRPEPAPPVGPPGVEVQTVEARSEPVEADDDEEEDDDGADFAGDLGHPLISVIRSPTSCRPWPPHWRWAVCTPCVISRCVARSSGSR